MSKDSLTSRLDDFFQLGVCLLLYALGTETRRLESQCLGIPGCAFTVSPVTDHAFIAIDYFARGGIPRSGRLVRERPEREALRSQSSLRMHPEARLIKLIR